MNLHIVLYCKLLFKIEKNANTKKYFFIFISPVILRRENPGAKDCFTYHKIEQYLTVNLRIKIQTLYKLSRECKSNYYLQLTIIVEICKRKDIVKPETSTQDHLVVF